MGLDMYLSARSVDNNEIGYWRKANAIHSWIIDNVADGEDESCREIILTANDVLDLKRRCEQVLENNQLADELLPTRGGFFFGSLEYDEWYFEDLKKTIPILDKALEHIGLGHEIVYLAWW